jgi:phosphoribosyl-ATP pyrophosphohydrolase
MSVLTHDNEPLIGLMLVENGQEVICYVTSDDAADAATSSADIQAALATIGAFSDLDFDDMMDALDRNRDANLPTPPIDLEL